MIARFDSVLPDRSKSQTYNLQRRKVPGGLAFSEFKGYEDWQAVGPSLTDAANVIRLILANPSPYLSCPRNTERIPR